MYRDPLLRYLLLDAGKIVHAREAGLDRHHGLTSRCSKVVRGFPFQYVFLIVSWLFFLLRRKRLDVAGCTWGGMKRDGCGR